MFQIKYADFNEAQCHVLIFCMVSQFWEISSHLMGCDAV